MGSLVAIWARGDAHRVQEGTNCFVPLSVMQCCDLISRVFSCAYALVVLFFLSIVPKNKIVKVRNTKYENFDVTGRRRLRDAQPQDKSVVYKECCRG